MFTRVKHRFSRGRGRGRRQANQRLTAGRLDTPGAAVRWRAAVQAQGYAGALLRTHALRPAWHFVSGYKDRSANPLNTLTVFVEGARLFLPLVSR